MLTTDTKASFLFGAGRENEPKTPEVEVQDLRYSEWRNASRFTGKA